MQTFTYFITKIETEKYKLSCKKKIESKHERSLVQITKKITEKHCESLKI